MTIEDLRSHLDAWFQAFSQIEIYRSLDGKRAAASWHMVVTMTGRLDPPGLEPTGLTGDVTGMCLMEDLD